MSEIVWGRYPYITNLTHAQRWLTIQIRLGLANNTIQAYGRALEDYLKFCAVEGINPETVTREHIAAYVHALSARPSLRPRQAPSIDSVVGLSNATLQQKLTAIRLFYDFLIEEGLREHNPVGRGRYTPGRAIAGKSERGLIPRYHKLPWIPDDEQWQAILQTAKHESLRNRTMMAFAYDAGLRREELCSLLTSDVNPARRLLRIRAETTKNRQERIVPFSEAATILYTGYLRERQQLSNSRGPLFLSESSRNLAEPISIWTWSKVVKGIAERSGVLQFTTHTLRHLCLTDLARSGWDVHEIATFAGHRTTQSTLLYIHLSGHELAQKLEQGMASIHSWRMQILAEMLK